MIKFENVSKIYPNGTKGLTDVNLQINQGEFVAIIGTSGAGKSTLIRCVNGLNDITSGSLIVNDTGVSKLKGKELRKFRRHVGMIFQSYNLVPRVTVLKNVMFARVPDMSLFKVIFGLFSKEDKLVALDSLNKVGILDKAYIRADQLSGGQQQRVSLARALSQESEILLADEPVSALDLSVQAQVLNFMKKIQKDMGLSYLFISHDLGVVKHMCDYINIMYRGRLVERGTKEDIYKDPQHIYTKRLIAAIPETDPRLKEQLIANRVKVEQEYKELEKDYYDEKGKVFDLIKLTDTHYVAKKGVK